MFSGKETPPPSHAPRTKKKKTVWKWFTRTYISDKYISFNILISYTYKLDHTFTYILHTYILLYIITTWKYLPSLSIFFFSLSFSPSSYILFYSLSFILSTPPSLSIFFLSLFLLLFVFNSLLHFLLFPSLVFFFLSLSLFLLYFLHSLSFPFLSFSLFFIFPALQ